ncbi:MAG: hypothetical protein V9H26_16445 [Verrucomicrobiota bacterium]
MKRTMTGLAMVVVVGLVGGCAALDRGYDTEVTWTDTPVVKVTTNTVVVTNVVPQVVERQSVVLVTNQATGAVSGYVAREPVATNLVTLLVTNTIPVFETNVVQVPVTNLVAKPAALAAIEATGGVVNTFLPGVGSLVALLLGGFYHGYRQVRNRKVNEALVQGVETARAILETTPQGKSADAAFVKWLMAHQKEAGVFTTVAGLVDNLTRQSSGQADGAGDCRAGEARAGGSLTGW